MVYSIGRADAAKLLGVSTRSIDRYIRKGKIRARKVGKLMMLHKEDVNIIVNGGVQQDYEIVTDTPKKSSAQPEEVSTSLSTAGASEVLDILNNKMKEKDEIIQELSYKVGKLESELQNSIPKLEHRKATLMLEEAQHKRAEDAQNLKEQNHQLARKLGRERHVATFFILASFVLLAILIPILLRYFQLREVIEKFQ